MVAIQELVWTIRPDLIIETGIAHGGSLILSASMLAMLPPALVVMLMQKWFVKGLVDTEK